MSKKSKYDRNIQYYQNDIRTRINNMKSLCFDAEKLGIQTLVVLADQGEQLEDITSHLKLMDETLNTTGKLIKIRKGFRQRFVDLFCIKIPQKIHVDKNLTLTQNKKCQSTPTRKRVTFFFFVSIYFIEFHCFLFIKSFYLDNKNCKFTSYLSFK